MKNFYYYILSGLAILLLAFVLSNDAEAKQAQYIDSLVEGPSVSLLSAWGEDIKVDAEALNVVCTYEASFTSAYEEFQEGLFVERLTAFKVTHAVCNLNADKFLDMLESNDLGPRAVILPVRNLLTIMPLEPGMSPACQGSLLLSFHIVDADFFEGLPEQYLFVEVPSEITVIDKTCK